MKRISGVCLVAIILLSATAAEAQSLPKLKVSSNGRYFQTGNGKPFFWLGDTGWLLFVKADRKDAVHYLQTRKEQGFNVVQVMVLHELKVAKNAYGDSALVSFDVSKPALTPGNDFNNAAAYDYWDHVDYIIEEAEKLGIYMALVPVWGSNVKGGHVTTSQASAYAKFLADRYKNRSNIIWLNGGDIKGTDGLEVWKVIGNTLRKNDPNHLITFHPRGRLSSSEWFHNEPWMDFNMFQSGHKSYSQDTSSNERLHYGEDNWKYVEADYKLSPVKPTIDGEPSYENIPHGLHDSTQPRWTAPDLRRYAYWSVFAGAPGFTYGENSVMQFHSRGDKDSNFGVNKNWKQTILADGANQMRHLRTLMTSMDSYFDRVPAQDIIIDNTGSRYDYVLATKAKKYALVYVYMGQNFEVDASKLGFEVKKVTWFSPISGARSTIDIKGKAPKMQFNPPGEPAAGNDWVLIIE